MPHQDNPRKEPEEKRRFIREKIVKQPVTRAEKWRRFVRLCIAAAIFGVVSAVTFAVTAPFMKRCIGKEPTGESTVISIPKDEETEPTESETTEEARPAETTDIEEIVRREMENYSPDIEDITVMAEQIRAVAEEADKGIVTVYSVTRSTDLFENPVETSGQYAGAVIAQTPAQLLILTVDSAVDQADSIQVLLGSGTKVDAAVKGTDHVSGLAVIAVDAVNLQAEELEKIKVLELGNSFLMKQGDFILTAGSPAGMVHSVGYGMIAHITKDSQIVDGVTRLIYTNAHCQADKGSFLFNLKGQLIGWVTDDFKNESNGSMSIVRSISEYKGILEKMTNGIPAPYMGIMFQEVNDQLQSQGMPRGIYVTKAVADSPAYNAGIQSGDIITKIGTREILSMKDFQNVMEALREGNEVTVMAERNGKEEYTELEFQVVIGAR